MLGFSIRVSIAQFPDSGSKQEDTEESLPENPTVTLVGFQILIFHPKLLSIIYFLAFSLKELLFLFLLSPEF